MANPWEPLLTQWNQNVFASPSSVAQLPPEIVAARWLGSPGATSQQLLALERRLGMQLPRSYREFLEFTNGWWLATAFVYHIWATDQVEWPRVRHEEDWIKPWATNQEPVSDEDYFVYGEEQDPVNMRTEYLSTALEISDVADGALLLLNPRILTPEGEWEAWFIASWMAGATRYQSFWDLMHGKYQSFVELRNV